MDKRFIANYHTHTFRCKHAGGVPADYAAVAVANGMEILGISDHMPYADDRFGLRMDMAEFDDYLREIQAARDAFPQLQIYSGLECEYLPQELEHLKKLRSQLDYMILGQHFFQDRQGNLCYTYDLKDTHQLIGYARSIAQALETGLFDCVAHPDLMGVHDFPTDENYKKAVEIILDAAEAYQIPLEINANGIRRDPSWHSSFRDAVHNYPYPDSRFFAMAAQRKNLQFIINADAHSPQEMCQSHIDKAFDFAQDFRLSLISTLPIKQQK